MHVRAVLAAHRPGYRVDSVVPAGAGLDNTVYEVNGELIVRFAREPDPARLDREVRLLALLAGISPLPVPQPVLSVPELGCMAYPKLPGTPLLDVPPAHRPQIGAELGRFLAALHATPLPLVADLVEVDDPPLAALLAEAAATFARIGVGLAPDHRRAVEAFLSAPPPPGPDALVFSHHDLGIEHILVDGDRVTGVIDWSDAAIGDPAYDVGKLHRDLGVGGADPRMLFHARCGLLEDLAYGLTTGRRAYVDKSLAALPRLFSDAGDNPVAGGV